MSLNSDPHGFKLPVRIPGAPERITWLELAATAKALLRTSFDAFRRRPGAYEAAMNQATWWHFWVLVGAASLIGGAATALTLLILEVQLTALLPGYSTDLSTPVLGLIVGTPASFLAFYGSSYAAYWWATNQAGGQARLIEHSYALAVIWAAENIIAGVVTLALSAVGLAVVALMISVGVVVYALAVMTGHLSRLYQFPDRWRTWATAAVMVVTSWMVSVLVQDILS